MGRSRRKRDKRFERNSKGDEDSLIHEPRLEEAGEWFSGIEVGEVMTNSDVDAEIRCEVASIIYPFSAGRGE